MFGKKQCNFLANTNLKFMRSVPSLTIACILFGVSRQHYVVLAQFWSTCNPYTPPLNAHHPSQTALRKILGCCGNTKRHCRNAPCCRNIAAIPCNGHCRNVAATLQLRLHCRSIAAIPCCRNIAAMGPLLQYAVRIAAIRNASTHCRNIAAMTCCRNIAAMPWGIADYLKASEPFAHFARCPRTLGLRTAQPSRRSGPLQPGPSFASKAARGADSGIQTRRRQEDGGQRGSDLQLGQFLRKV